MDVDAVSKKVSEMWAQACRDQGIQLVEASAQMLPGDDGCRRYSGPLDVDGSVAPFEVAAGAIDDPRMVGIVGNMLGRDIAQWAGQLAKSNVKQIEYFAPPDVRVATPQTVQDHVAPRKVVWMLYAKMVVTDPASITVTV